MVIVLFVEDDIDEDDESKESVLNNSLRTSLQEAKAGKTRAVSKLWDGIDAE
ncbi:hypothetical protein [Chlorogloeopsis sp. ULAP01]|uniref:hypothetical protein n=1 Tax=Chlorogloeopsis sp. ULAP01 TaxID=3056483 RepID=UPI00301437DA